MNRAPLKVMSIGGTRPEAIKLAPLCRALLLRVGIEHILIATGQHGQLFHDALDPFGIVVDVDLALPNIAIADFCLRLKSALVSVFRSFSPDLVLVQGDTSSAWAAASAAHDAGIRIGHIEAGLRSGDINLPWPEERNRREIDAISTLLFAPSAVAATNLIGSRGRIYVTGNTGIDAMRYIMEQASLPLTRQAQPAERHIIVTCHRRESIVDMPALMQALRMIAEREDVCIHMPVHPNPAIAALVHDTASYSPRIIIDRAIPYAAMLERLRDCYLLLTDSGGLQEEAAALGVPTLVLRRNTERPEPIANGCARLIGMDADRIHAEATRILDDPAVHAAMSQPCFPYGRGDAAHRIADAIAAWAAEPVEVRGTFP